MLNIVALASLASASLAYAKAVPAGKDNALWVSPVAPGSPLPDCVKLGNYYGAYGRPLTYVSALSSGNDAACAGALTMGNHPHGQVVPAPEEGATLVWLQESGVDESLRILEAPFVNELQGIAERVEEYVEYEVLDAQSASADEYGMRKQIVFPGARHLRGTRGLMILSFTESSALVSVPNSVLSHLDMFLPRFVSAIALSEGPSSFVPVPPNAIKRVTTLLEKLTFNPDIASILSSLSVTSMRKDIRHLSGEDGGGILSRHSFSPGALVAANWIQEQIEETGATCIQDPFLPGYAPNVICRYPSTVNTSAIVLLSAHYDSRGSFGSTRAPGANDDGSGVTHLLAIARAIKRNGVAFKSNVELVAFAGEEQGLLGSKAYARKLSVLQANITLMMQADMLAYHSPTEPLQLGLPDIIGLPEAAYLIANVSRIYSPELTIGITPACCSDHQSFHGEGFPSTQVFERAGPILDPKYHNSGDLSDRVGYDLEQVRSIAKVTFASLLEAAGFEIKHAQ